MTKQPLVHIDIMTDEKRLEYAAQLTAQLNVDSVDSEDIYNLMNHSGFNTKTQIEQAANAMAYIRLRDFEHYTRVRAYKKVFPKRWTSSDTDQAIRARAHRFESTKTYKLLIAEMQMNFYGVFAVERVHVMNETLRRAYDPDTSEKYQFEYFKMFMEQTKQPESMTKTVDININTDGVSIKDVENKLDAISEQLVGKTQSEIMDAILVESDGS